MKNDNQMRISGLLLIIALFGCGKEETPQTEAIKYEGSQKVTVTGYSDNLMEPFLSRDGAILIFNNSNDASVDTNLHWATRSNDTSFEYMGEVAGVNTASLEGVPSMDMNGVLYFVSTREYDQTLATIYQASFISGTATNVTQVAGISKNQVGWLNFDVEVNASGEFLYSVDGRFDQTGGPHESDIFITQKMTGEFQRLSNSNEILKNINTDALEYAACISENNLELYFTRVEVPLSSSSMPRILFSTRNNVNEPFGQPATIQSISGFVEAATITPDGNLYYHKRDETGKFSLYMTKRVK